MAHLETQESYKIVINSRDLINSKTDGDKRIKSLSPSLEYHSKNNSFFPILLVLLVSFSLIFLLCVVPFSQALNENTKIPYIKSPISISTFPSNTSNINVNYSENSGHLQGYDVSGLTTYFTGIFDLAYCKLTGCTIDGDVIVTSGHKLFGSYFGNFNYDAQPIVWDITSGFPFVWRDGLNQVMNLTTGELNLYYNNNTQRGNLSGINTINPRGDVTRIGGNVIMSNNLTIDHGTANLWDAVFGDIAGGRFISISGRGPATAGAEIKYTGTNLRFYDDSSKVSLVLERGSGNVNATNNLNVIGNVTVGSPLSLVGRVNIAGGMFADSGIISPIGQPWRWNGYYSGGEKYLLVGYAGAINVETSNGRMAFYLAPSGSANAVATYINPFTLWNNGDAEFYYNANMTKNLNVIGNVTASLYNQINISTRAGIGDCPSGQVVVNTTTGGVQCISLASIYYNATIGWVINGVIDGGSIVDTRHPDGKYDGKTFNFSEASGSPGLDLRINFTNIDSFNQGVIRYRTSSLSGAYPIIQMWNYDTSAWEDYPPISQSTLFATIEQSVFDSTEHLSGGIAQMRLYKSSNGNTNNHYYVDWISVIKGYGTPSGEEVDPYSVHTDGTTPLTGDWNVGNKSITNIYSINSSIYYTRNWITYEDSAGNLIQKRNP